VKKKYKYLELRPGAHWPKGPSGRALLRRLNKTAKRLRTTIRITSGRRTPAEQWAAYQDYLRGGILAAPCCNKNWLHDLAHCGRRCQSNHCVSKAADVVIERPGRGWVNIGEWPKARQIMGKNGLCLPVGQGETWHVEIGDTWNS